LRELQDRWKAWQELTDTEVVADLISFCSFKLEQMR
jgi:hypothetical protein